MASKKYEWKDSNLALFGSDAEKEVKKESANSEPAWEGAGENVGLQIWRIVQFKVTELSQLDYGKFFSGDSYIILNTYKANPDSEALKFDVHFWIGKYSTQDEYGTAAYKTVELDTYLDDAPVQHREVQGCESELFKSYFPKGITTMKGGAESGFNNVKAEEYTPRLFHFSGAKTNIVVKEVQRCRSRLDSGDVFILDMGQMLYQWNGSGSNKDEMWKATQYLHQLKDERQKCHSHEVLDEQSTEDDHPFYKHLSAGGKKKDAKKKDTDVAKKTLFKVSDASGELQIAKIKDEDITMDDLDSNDVFVLDCGKECFVWVGKDASPCEKKNGMGYAHKHLSTTAHPFAPITVLREGQNQPSFMMALAA